MKCAAFLLIWLAMVSPEVLHGHPAGGAGAHKTIEGFVTKASITIDGKLDEADWSRAQIADDFIERKPNLRSTPPERCRFAVIFTAEALYVGVWLHDTQPEAIRARTYTRDTFSIFADDAISLKLDVGHDHRSTFGFGVNVAGARLDYKAVNEGDFQSGFDTLWSAGTTRFDDGWSAEFRIPWSSIGIDPSSPPQRIGINLSRDHSRRAATYDWSVMPPPYTPVTASRYGHLTGFEALSRLPDVHSNRGFLNNLVVVPYLAGGLERPDSGTMTLKGTGGADIVHGLGQTWTTHLTINTDFAQVDVDDRVVNLSRFGLFLPEKRDFFLRDADLFAFGALQSAQLFHSRRIGLNEGKALPILSGLKLVGQSSENTRLGLLEVVTRNEEGIPWTSNLVGRVQHELGGGTNVGVMWTHRQSLEEMDDRNFVIGFDASYRSSTSPLLVEVFTMGSETGAAATGATAEVAGRDDPVAPLAERELGAGVGLKVDWRGELFHPVTEYYYLGPGFRADLGFFRRTEVHQSVTHLMFEPRVERMGIERILFFLAGDGAWTAPGIDLLDHNIALGFNLSGIGGWGLTFLWMTGALTVEEEFTVGPNTAIASGRYRRERLYANASTPYTAPVVLEVNALFEDYFDGERKNASARIQFKPAPIFRADAGLSYDQVRFDDGREGFDAWILNGRVTLGFSTRLGLDVYTGWNYLDENLLLQSRLRWTYTEASDLYVVYQQDLNTEGWATNFQSVQLKATYFWF
jgi:hypothetical protein